MSEWERLDNWKMLEAVLRRWAYGIKSGDLLVELTIRDGKPVVATRYCGKLEIGEVCSTDPEWVFGRHNALHLTPDE